VLACLELEPRAVAALAGLVALALLFVAAPALAVSTGPTRTATVGNALPGMLTLEEALTTFREVGFDLLIAEAAVQSAEGDVRIARGNFNPNVSYNFSHIFNYDPAQVCPGGADKCSPNVHSLVLSDSNAIADAIVGKRGLRIDVAEAALQAARMARVDAQRTLEFQLKSQYTQAVLAQDLLDFAVDVAKAWNQTFELVHIRYEKGAISEADEAKVETAKLEAEQAVASAMQALRSARAGVAFLLGARDRIPEFEVDRSLLKFSVPQRLVTASADTLLHDAYETRPDLKALRAQIERAQAAVASAQRARFPDLALNVGFNYAATGGGPFSSNTTPPTLTVGVSGNIPVFYQQQGEIQKAEADVRTQSVGLAKSRAQVVNDVSSAYANYSSTKQLVERMEGRLLERARLARDLTKYQFEKGAASLLEYFDAQRTFIATNVEYMQDLANYWTAVFQVEQAVGMELR
jgi:cobalt-zinc-cadmium efflux system outer membrane protein